MTTPHRQTPTTHTQGGYGAYHLGVCLMRHADKRSLSPGGRARKWL
jgi:hypothetical protein